MAGVGWTCERGDRIEKKASTKKLIIFESVTSLRQITSNHRVVSMISVFDLHLFATMVIDNDNELTPPLYHQHSYYRQRRRLQLYYYCHHCKFCLDALCCFCCWNFSIETNTIYFVLISAMALQPQH